VELDHPPRSSRRLLKLPPHLDSLPKFPFKRCKVNKCGTYISTSQTCDRPVMSTDSNKDVTGSPSTPITYVISRIPSTRSASMVGVSKIPTSSATQPMGSTRPIGTNPFGYIFGTPGQNYQSIPSLSNPFYFGMPNMTSQLSSSIPAANENISFGPGAWLLRMILSRLVEAISPK
jgi:hypothetical protein